MHNLLFCVHTLCMNSETNTLLLVSSSVRSKQLLCVVHGQGQKSEQKHTTKSFDEFHNHSPLLTMVYVTNNWCLNFYIYLQLKNKFHSMECQLTNKMIIAVILSVISIYTITVKLCHVFSRPDYNNKKIKQ